MNKLEKKIFVEGEITAETGMHIGGSSVGLTIGGADKIVIRNALTNEPYIPGSSLKGKMRSLVEKTIPEVAARIVDGKPCQCGECPACCLFGFPADAKNKKKNQGHLIVRDCALINREELEDAPETDMPMTEVKTEVSIDRITSMANPRQIERVPAGARFKLNIVLNVFENDDEKKLLDTLFMGLRLVRDDYLGGYGTRGYGRISIKVDELSFKDKETYEGSDEAKPYGEIASESLAGLQS